MTHCCQGWNIRYLSVFFFFFFQSFIKSFHFSFTHIKLHCQGFKNQYLFILSSSFYFTSFNECRFADSAKYARQKSKSLVYNQFTLNKLVGPTEFLCFMVLLLTKAGDCSTKVSGILHVSREFRGKVAAPGGGQLVNRALVEFDFWRLSVFDLLK